MESSSLTAKNSGCQKKRRLEIGCIKKPIKLYDFISSTSRIWQLSKAFIYPFILTHHFDADKDRRLEQHFCYYTEEQTVNLGNQQLMCLLIRWTENEEATRKSLLFSFLSSTFNLKLANKACLLKEIRRTRLIIWVSFSSQVDISH